jgi:hypothetical protein
LKAKIKISANQAQLNVVGFLSSFVTLVSLSHFSFVSTCVYPGERRRVARPHSHWRGGRGFNGPHSHWRGGRGEASPVGRGRSTFQRSVFSFHSPYILFFGGPSAMRAGGGTERAASFGWRALCLSHTHLGSSARRRQVQRGQTFSCADRFCPLIPVACRGRLPVP